MDGLDRLRSLLFASKVLLVEGATDREVVQGIFTQVKSENLKKACKEGILKTLDADQIIPIGSCQNVTKVIFFCNFIKIPCLCLINLDFFAKMKDNEKFSSKIDNFVIREELEKRYLNNELTTFVNEDFSKLSIKLEGEKYLYGKAILNTRF